MKRSLLTTNASISSKHDSAYVKSDDVDARIVFDVTVVSDRLTLNVNCAANHNGATCSQNWKEVYLPLALAGCPSKGFDQMACLQSACIWGCSKTVSQVYSMVSAEVRVVCMLALLSLQRLTRRSAHR